MTVISRFELDFFFFCGRIAAFQDTWPELEKWYGEKQNILVNINADVEERELYNKVESSLCEVMKEQEEGDFFSFYHFNVDV